MRIKAILVVSIFLGSCGGVVLDPAEGENAQQPSGPKCGSHKDPDSGTGGPDASGTIVPDELIAFCNYCPCEGCIDGMMEMYEHFRSRGCPSEFLAFYDCARTKQTDCKTWHYTPDAICATEYEVLTVCTGTCVENITPPQGPCSASCTGKRSWTVECQLQGPAYACQCTAGPKQGNTFLLNNCNGGWSTIAEPHCL